jgi:predicted lysophospholipase L1 biosynthesis ABC-type transport system permease subunit
MNTKHFSNNSIVGGVVLILLGAVLLGGTLNPFGLGWGSLWPLFLAVPGTGLLALAFSISKERRAVVVMPGVSLLLLSIFFFAFTLDKAEWSAQATLWPLYVMIPGLAALVAYLASDMEQPVYLMVGAVISTVAGALLVGTVTGSLYQLSERLLMLH